MKDSATYSKKLLKLFSALKKGAAKQKEPEYTDPIEAVVYAVISEHTTLKQAKTAKKKIESHFVDYNDLRVCRAEEIIEVIGLGKEVAQNIAADMTKVLNAVFDRYDMVSLEGLFEVGKRQAKKELEELDCFSRFVIGYCFLTALKGHAIPTTDNMIKYLNENELVYPGAKQSVIEGFLERQISSSDGYNFYCLLREESEKNTSQKTAAKKKTTAKKKTATKKKTAAKTTKKKTAVKKTTAKKKTTKKKK